MKALYVFVKLCSIHDPNLCVTHKEQIYTDMLPSSCAMRAQAMAAQAAEVLAKSTMRVAQFGCLPVGGRRI